MAALVHSSLATLAFRLQQKGRTQIWSRGVSGWQENVDSVPTNAARWLQDNVTFRMLRERQYLGVRHFLPSLYISPYIKKGGCVCKQSISDRENKKKVSPVYLPLKKSSHLRQPTWKCVIYHTICHRGKALPAKGRGGIIIGVFIFSIISLQKLCQQNQNAFFWAA